MIKLGAKPIKFELKLDWFCAHNAAGSVTKICINIRLNANVGRSRFSCHPYLKQVTATRTWLMRL